MARWRIPLSAAALRKRERRGLPPIPEEFSDLVTVTRFWPPVRQSTLCTEFDLAKRRARASGVTVPQGTTFRDLPPCGYRMPPVIPQPTANCQPERHHEFQTQVVAADQMASAVRVLTPPRRKSKKNAFAWRDERHDLQRKALHGASGANMASRT